MLHPGTAYLWAISLSVRFAGQVCELFVAEEQDSAAYARYAVRWRAEIDAGLGG